MKNINKRNHLKWIQKYNNFFIYLKKTIDTDLIKEMANKNNQRKCC